MDIVQYIDFLNENYFEEFRSQYSKLFKDVDQDMYRDFGEFIKRLENEKNSNNLAKLYNGYLTANQTTFNKKVDSLQSIEQINKIIMDELLSVFIDL